MIRYLLYDWIDPPIWYQTLILSLLGEQKLGLDTEFGSERRLDLWITFFTLIWVLIQIIVWSAVGIGLVLWYENSHPHI